MTIVTRAIKSVDFEVLQGMIIHKKMKTLGGSALTNTLVGPHSTLEGLGQGHTENPRREPFTTLLHRSG